MSQPSRSLPLKSGVHPASGDSGEDAEPYVEAVSLKFAKVDFHYRKQHSDGSLDPGEHFKYDLKANKIG